MKKYILSLLLLIFFGLGNSFARDLNSIPYYSNSQSFSFPLRGCLLLDKSQGWGYGKAPAYFFVNSSSYYNSSTDSCSDPNNGNGNYVYPEAVSFYSSSSTPNTSSYTSLKVALQVDGYINNNTTLTTFSLINHLASEATEANLRRNFLVPYAGLTDSDGIHYDKYFALSDQLCLVSDDGERHTLCNNGRSVASVGGGSKDAVFFYYPTEVASGRPSLFMVNFYEKKARSISADYETLARGLMGDLSYNDLYALDWTYSYSLEEYTSGTHGLDPLSYLSAPSQGLGNGFSYTMDSTFIDTSDYFNGGSSGVSPGTSIILDTTDYKQCVSWFGIVKKYTNLYGRCMTEGGYTFADSVINSNTAISQSDIDTISQNSEYGTVCSSFANYHNELISQFPDRFESPVSSYGNGLYLTAPFNSLAYTRWLYYVDYDFPNSEEFIWNISSSNLCGSIPVSSSNANEEISSWRTMIRNLGLDTGTGTVVDSAVNDNIGLFGFVADKLKAPVVDSYNSGFSQIVPPTCISTVSIPVMDMVVFGLAIVIVLSLFFFL